jgi:hypothetical protein
MNDDEMKFLSSFMAVHAHKADVTGNRCVYLQVADPKHLHPETPLLRFDRDDLTTTPELLDPHAPCVRQLIHTLNTYNCTCTRIIGIIFNQSNVRFHVLAKSEDVRRVLA